MSSFCWAFSGPHSATKSLWEFFGGFILQLDKERKYKIFMSQTQINKVQHSLYVRNIL